MQLILVTVIQRMYIKILRLTKSFNLEADEQRVANIDSKNLA